jgi:hypothetical protein
MASARLRFVLYSVAIVALVWWNPIYGLPRWLGWPLFVGVVYVLGEGVDALVRAIRRQREVADRSPE